MAHTTTTVTSAAWTQVSTLVASARVQNVGNTPIWIGASLSTSPPSDTGGAMLLMPGAYIGNAATLAQLFPGVGSGSMYVFAKSMGADSKLSTSHA